MDSNTIQYFLNSKMNQLRRAASLPGNSINVPISTQAIYKFRSSNWKHRYFWGKNTSFIYTFITFPHSTVSTKKQLPFSLMWIQQTCSAWGALCAHAVEQHMDTSTPSLPGAIWGKRCKNLPSPKMWVMSFVSTCFRLNSTSLTASMVWHSCLCAVRWPCSNSCKPSPSLMLENSWKKTTKNTAFCISDLLNENKKWSFIDLSGNLTC